MTLDQAITELRKRSQKVLLPLQLPTRDEVQECEMRLGTRFHPDLFHYLLRASDVVYGTKEPVTITSPTAHTHIDTVARGAWDKMEIPKSLLPICEDNGDYFCMEQSGRIVFWSHDGDTNEAGPISQLGLSGLDRQALIAEHSALRNVSIVCRAKRQMR